MSVRLAQLSILALNPRVALERGVLSARTHRVVQALSLFAYSRSLRVDTRARQVQVSVRTFWLLRRELNLPFAEIEAIRYQVQHLPTSFGWLRGGAGVTDRIEAFRIGVAVSAVPEPVHLISFVGEGAVATGWLGAILGDDFYDWYGTQEVASHEFVVRLQQALGVPIRSKLEQMAHSAMAPALEPCPQCGRAIKHRAPKCVYCGSRAPFA